MNDPNDPEQAADAVMDTIQKNRFATSQVPRKASIEFYECIAAQCRSWAETIRDEASDGE